MLRGVEYRQGSGVPQAEIAATEATGGYDRVLNIAVVGHGAMIRKYCLREAVAAADGTGASVDSRIESKVKANNNAVYEKLFVINRRVAASSDENDSHLSETVVLQEAVGDCGLVMDAPTRENAMAVVAPRDVESCSVPFDVSPFLNLTTAGSSSVPTACEAAADVKGAFPVVYRSPEMKADVEENSRGKSALADLSAAHSNSNK